LMATPSAHVCKNFRLRLNQTSLHSNSFSANKK
jgi:hypothetical protein